MVMFIHISYDTDSADLKSKEKQRRVKNGINDTLKNAFSKSNDEDLNVFLLCWSWTSSY